MQAPRILIVEDEEKIREVLRAYLVREGFSVVEAGRGDEGLELYKSGGADLVILDLMLPGLSGERVAAAIRQQGATPILMLTARGEEWERLKGFELGADDYVVKPFSPREVVLRIRAILKRGGQGLPDDRPAVQAGPLSMDPVTRTATTGGNDLGLTPTEFDLLFEMASHPGRVFRRTQLAALALGYDHEAYERTIDSHIKNLRRKMGEEATLIETVFGVGYRFSVPAAQ